ncbi:MAG: hypothetical protein A3K10_11885 [Bacteroidetes bacterium RIFCSPLOWO2_12_FULL_31_6]|nr:MAG: hypothetical protein A3K10_11885 [Bacteroidetes bacterium RIFCSPLOWO2_12_FULL_31_6]
MKNNKAITYILILAVVAVWGWVIYNIIKKQGPIDNTNLAFDNNLKTDSSNAQLDTFSLFADYRDPFVIKYVSMNLAQDLNLEEEKIKEIKVKPIIEWPSIKYGGTVKNNHSERKLALINIAEQNHLLGIGDTAQEVKVYGIYPDSLILLYKNDKKTIVKSKNITQQSTSPTDEKEKKKKNR